MFLFRVVLFFELFLFNIMFTYSSEPVNLKEKRGLTMKFCKESLVINGAEFYKSSNMFLNTDIADVKQTFLIPSYFYEGIKIGLGILKIKVLEEFVKQEQFIVALKSTSCDINLKDSTYSVVRFTLKKKTNNFAFGTLPRFYVHLDELILLYNNCSDLSCFLSGQTSLKYVNFDRIKTDFEYNFDYMFSSCRSIEYIDFPFKKISVRSMIGMFENCSKLKFLDLSMFDTKNVKDMRFIFSNCSTLSDVKLYTFDTSNVTDMSCMFYGCRNLKSLDLYRFNTSEVTDMSSMFSGCSSLTDINLTNFNTQTVTNMSGMFSGCSSLKELNLSKFKTNYVENMFGMFSGCCSLNSIDLSNFDTSNVKNMGFMFRGCKLLKEIDLSSFDIINVNFMNSMFEGCKSLKKIKLSSIFNTSNVEYMCYMFKNCTNLTEIDISKLDTENAADIFGMFENCDKLKNNTDLSKFNI